MIRRPEEPSRRQTTPPILPSPAPQPSQEPDAVAALPDQLVAFPDQVAELPDPVEALPDPAAVLPLQPAAQPVGEVPLVAPQPVQPIPPPHDIEEISSSKSREASVNFAPRGSVSIISPLLSDFHPVP
ncbi:uncharacterized protein LOC127257713 [Andrographis paniculata]|uniref:uncharacterized protein LOC127257713 n=1 Tax=Andrographis paniculata TaxID=175694 RepID=UPI0021E7F191|nr:uncharacterized protein LOC127257713 [Andrographis paniculata]